MGMEKSTEFLDEIGLLSEEAETLGIHLSFSQVQLFRDYLRELWEWNKRFNLTGLKTRERVVIELFLDSLVPSPFLPKGGTLLDAGSGAGFPGVPLKILHPDVETLLLESNGRRVTFLRHIVRSLGLRNTRVIQGRIEAPQEWFHESGFDAISARAVADLRRIALWCSPLLKAGGLLAAFLGAAGEKILEQDMPFLAGLGLRVERHIPYLLPGKQSERHTFIFIREKPEGIWCYVPEVP